MKIKIIILFLLLNASLMKATNPTIFNYGYTLGIGMSTSTLLGNGPNTRSMNPLVNQETSDLLGGSFKGAQPGVDIRFTYQLDDNGLFRMPLGIDMSFYDAIDKYPISKYIKDRYENSSMIIAPYLALNYHFIKLEKAMASAYISFEVKANILSESSFRLTRTYDNTPTENFDSTLHYKKSTLRIGTSLKLGVEGELAEDYLINISGGVGILNALLRDPNRGELLTPRIGGVTTKETSETIAFNFSFLIMLQYKFGK